jgi:hypothetical protein
MATTLATMLTKLTERLQDDDSVLEAGEMISAVREAVVDYSRYRPSEAVADIAGTGGYDYALPAAWVTDFSHLLCVEFPAGERIPVYLEETDYGLYRTTTTTQLRLLTVTPSATQTVRVTFTVPHMVTTQASTLPAQDETAVANKAAAIGCGWIAAHYASQGESSLNAEAAAQESKSQRWADMAKYFDALYNRHLGIGKGNDAAPVVAASTAQDWDSSLAIDDPWTFGQNRLTHASWQR